MAHKFNLPVHCLCYVFIVLALVACDNQAPSLPTAPAVIKPHDPGVRLGEPGAVGPLPSLDSQYQNLYVAGLKEFNNQDKVKDDGLGPTYNFISCEGCHAYPGPGGSSPGPTKNNTKPINPQYTFWKDNLSQTNQIPSFIKGDDLANPGFTPVREARFIHHTENNTTVLDGGVHSLFTIVGLPDADKCTNLKQPDFEKEVKGKNVIFRIPTPVFGAGLIEQIPDTAIVENQKREAKQKENYGINGRSNIAMAGRTNTGSGLPNHNGNDGTIARFGWKAQNKSLLVFAGEAYNVEMGISNELFPTERNEQPECQGKPAPNDRTRPEKFNRADPNSDPLDILSDVEKFAAFMRLLAPPTPSENLPGGATSIGRGKKAFEKVGCAYCHTPQMMTGESEIPQLSKKPVNLYSDLLIHNMGPNLADGVEQGQAKGDEFRTAPLWGLGQRMWFLHDGRTFDLLQAIKEHASGTENGQSEANKSVQEFHGLAKESQQDLLNFLRSL